MTSVSHIRLLFLSGALWLYITPSDLLTVEWAFLRQPERQYPELRAHLTKVVALLSRWSRGERTSTRIENSLVYREESSLPICFNPEWICECKLCSTHRGLINQDEEKLIVITRMAHLTTGSPELRLVTERLSQKVLSQPRPRSSIHCPRIRPLALLLSIHRIFFLPAEMPRGL